MKLKMKPFRIDIYDEETKKPHGAITFKLNGKIELSKLLYRLPKEDQKKIIEKFQEAFDIMNNCLKNL